MKVSAGLAQTFRVCVLPVMRFTDLKVCGRACIAITLVQLPSADNFTSVLFTATLSTTSFIVSDKTAFVGRAPITQCLASLISFNQLKPKSLCQLLRKPDRNE